MKILSIILPALMASIVQASEPRYLCIDVKVTGFKTDQDFKIREFKPSKYLVRPAKNTDGAHSLADLVVFNMDHDFIEYSISYDENYPSISRKFLFSPNFRMNTETMRFTRISHGGWNADNPNGDDAVIAIGKCSAL